MEWFARFLLGLRARPSDVARIRKVAPEILRDPHEIDEERPRTARPIMLIVPEGVVVGGEMRAAIRAWALNAMEGDEALKVTGDARECPMPDCPLHPHNHTSSGGTSAGESLPSASGASSAEPAPASDAEPVILRALTMGGGPDRRPPLHAFLNLVRQTHAGAGEVRRLWITDPYVFANTGERGDQRGFDSFAAYLDALAVPPAGFDLIVPAGGGRGRAAWEQQLRHRHPNARVRSLPAGLRFHDRFYVALHASGQLRAVFGPSLNGLTASDIVLMGSIDDDGTLGRFRSWFAA